MALTGYRGSEDFRFWSKVIIAENGCWLWTATKIKGYGWFALEQQAGEKRQSILAHLWSYNYCIGSIPDGLEPDHLCRNRACVNPWHLEPVTHQINVLRGNGISAMHATKTVCSRGHNNWYIRPDGTGRMCKTCNKLKRQERENI